MKKNNKNLLKFEYKNIIFKYNMFEPNFSFPMPKNKKYDSVKQLAKDHNLICREYMDCGELKVGLWDKYI